MPRTKDVIALMKGLQLIAKASVQTNEDHLRHLWANSSFRDIILNNCVHSKGLAERLNKNPGEEIENIRQLVNEFVERTAVTTDSLYKFGISRSDIAAKFSEKVTEISGKSAKTTAEATSNESFDISSITLKELEQYLSNQYEQTSTEKNADPKLFLNDEKYIKEWMQFISDQKPTIVEPENLSIIQNVKPSEPLSEKIEISTEKTSKNDPISDEKVEKINELSSVAKQRKVPSSRIGRMASFGGLFAGLGIGTISELTKGALGLGGSTDMKSAFLSPQNAERIVDTLCRVRGAALKIGQILSIQDSSLVSPQIVKAFDRVRQSADYMPDWQVEKVMRGEFGRDWREKFVTFDEKPFAAASIGQVHRGVLQNGMEVAVKIQYPGVARSIESDIDNLVGMMKLWNVFPAGIFIDNIVKVAKRELVWEVDYLREANYTEKFGQMIAKYPEYRVPQVVRELSTKNVLATELLPGLPLDKCFEMSYEHRQQIGESVFKLCLREIFEFRCMQTDPNWSNFLYDASTKKLMLIDFGSTRFYEDEFIEKYRRVILAAVKNDYNGVLTLSREMNFLTGYESKQMEEAHVNAVMILGELFGCKGEFDFGKQNTTKRIASLVPTMIAHRLCPPPEEIYSLHRKLSGVFLLCSRLNIKIDCHPIFEEIIGK